MRALTFLRTCSISKVTSTFSGKRLQKRGKINEYLCQRTTYPGYCQKNIMTNVIMYSLTNIAIAVSYIIRKYSFENLFEIFSWHQDRCS